MISNVEIILHQILKNETVGCNSSSISVSCRSLCWRNALFGLGDQV